MTGKRQTSKENRRRRIINSARDHFLKNGYEATKIEAIAESSDVSAVTIYNYYRTKGGVLLALVSASDEILIEKIETLINQTHNDSLSAIHAFSKTINDHAFTYLDRKIWQHILSTSMLEGDTDFGKAYKLLDAKLIVYLAKFLEILSRKDIYPRDIDYMVAAEVFYNLHNARFQGYICDNDMTPEQRDTSTYRDLAFLLS